VLSGFLITTKLLKEPIDLKKFYVRRFFRLLPAAWAYLAVLVLLDWLAGAHHITLQGLSASLLFYRNFGGNSGGGITLHFWSLSLEEQFYLTWPLAVLIAGPKYSRWIATAGTLGCAAYRWIFWGRYDQSFMNLQTQVRIDAILVGCLLGLWLSNPQFAEWAKRWSRYLALPTVIVLIRCFVRFHRLPPLHESFCIALLISLTLLQSDCWFARLFSFRPLGWLGLISYSVYVWQELFMAFRNAWLICIGVPLFALGSYYFIELPFTRFGGRLTSPNQDAICKKPSSGGLVLLHLIQDSR
jgi:peptidoglycan/LPS O-acetylase OafA/YrhL